MPKCASSALETALGPHMDVVIKGVPAAKHTPFRKYNRYLKGYFEGFGKAPMETACLFREPVAWLNSWWRYRGRSELRDHEKSTAGMTFDTFVDRYIEGARVPADVGRQSRFISDANGNPSVDHLFRYEDLDGFQDFISKRTGLRFELGRENVSPSAHGNAGLRSETEDRLREALALDFKIHAGLAGK